MREQECSRERSRRVQLMTPTANRRSCQSSSREGTHEPIPQPNFGLLQAISVSERHIPARGSSVIGRLDQHSLAADPFVTGQQFGVLQWQQPIVSYSTNAEAVPAYPSRPQDDPFIFHPYQPEPQHIGRSVQSSTHSSAQLPEHLISGCFNPMLHNNVSLQPEPSYHFEPLFHGENAGYHHGFPQFRTPAQHEEFLHREMLWNLHVREQSSHTNRTTQQQREERRWREIQQLQQLQRQREQERLTREEQLT
jgi:hypothetical protein